MEKTVNGFICRTAEDEAGVYFDMALSMLETVIKQKEEGKDCVMIVPVGPTKQYNLLADMVNTLGISLKHVHFFNMDEYMTSPTEVIPESDPLSFHGRMKREFYDRLRPELAVPPDQRHFPEPGREAEYDRMLAALGNACACYGGLGINGHIAFNEPPEPGTRITPDEFASLGTRVLPISRETKTINAYGYNRGDLGGMPEWCITVGMKQILSSRKIYIALNRPWQNGPLKKTLSGIQTPFVPASLLSRHKNVTFVGTEEVMKGLIF